MNSKRFTCVCMCLMCLGCSPNFNNRLSASESLGSSERLSYRNAYYFDSEADEGGNGDRNAPFNSLSAIETIGLLPGDALLFKRGSLFVGTVALKQLKGTAEEPIVISDYGEGNLPRINGHDSEEKAILYIENCSFLRIENLEIFDDTNHEGDRRGVLINATGDGKEEVKTYSDISLERLYVHDIRGYADAENGGMSLASKKTGGIHVWSEDGKGRFDRLTIRNCTIQNVDNAGIATWYMPNEKKISPYRDDFSKYAYSNVRIADNEISFIGKNAIFARNLLGGIIEGNTVYETAIRCFSGNQIVTSYVYGTVIQHNEGYHNRASPRESDGVLNDGSMLDADIQSRETIWQYNYSHDNSFGLFLSCTTYDPDLGFEDRTVVRYNLSANDCGKNGIIFLNYDVLGKMEIYNNTIVTGKKASPIIFQSNGNKKHRYSFFNNLIYNASENAEFRLNESDEAVIHDNLVFSESGREIDRMSDFRSLNENGMYEDPKFFASMADSMDDLIGMDATIAFILNEDSPALNRGVFVENVKEDFYGNPYRKSIGCYCGE